MFLHRPRSQMNRNFAFKDFSSWIWDYAKIHWEAAGQCNATLGVYLFTFRPMWHMGKAYRTKVWYTSRLRTCASRGRTTVCNWWRHAIAAREVTSEVITFECCNYKGQHRFDHPCARHKRSVKVQRWNTNGVGHYRIVNRLVINHFLSVEFQCFLKFKTLIVATVWMMNCSCGNWYMTDLIHIDSSVNWFADWLEDGRFNGNRRFITIFITTRYWAYTEPGKSTLHPNAQCFEDQLWFPVPDARYIWFPLSFR